MAEKLHQGKAYALFLATLMLCGCTFAQTQQQPQDDEVFAPFLAVKRIVLFPRDSSARMILRVYVNDIEYLVPREQTKFLKEGPIDASDQWLRLPSAASYTIRFEMLLNDQEASSANVVPTYRPTPFRLVDAKPQIVTPELPTDQQLFASQRSSILPGGVRRIPPIDGEYKVYQVTDGTRSAAVRAIISYQLSTRKACLNDPC
jgi:hypothetical protein